MAETEPDIAEYAVKPPYFEALKERTLNTSSYILFGERGAGKSATRLTIFKELWSHKGSGQRVPLAVNVSDFSAVIERRKLHNLSEAALIKEVAFVVLESLLAWLSSLEEDERTVLLGTMNDDENALCYTLLRDFYLSRPAAKRERSVYEAMALFNQAFFAKSKLWVERRWDPIARLIGAITDALSHHYINTQQSIAGAVTETILSNQDGEFDSVLSLRRLVTLARIFDFSGVVVLIDKVDETEATSNSADQTAELIHPLLARVQLVEVDGFAWTFFLWHRVKALFEGDEHRVRLDKIAHATVSWDDEFFSQMLDRRMTFFSDGRLNFSGLFDAMVDVKTARADLIRVSIRSPRELIRLMDTIIREHDIVHASKTKVMLLDSVSIENGIDKYVTDVIGTVYGERLLAQIFRLNRTVFTNKDVRFTFRVGAQSARTRIQSWESAGILKFSGTRAVEGTQGGKPENEYTISDARIERVMRRQLISYEAANLIEEPEYMAENE